jgi:hypothetical protein
MILQLQYHVWMSVVLKKCLTALRNMVRIQLGALMSMTAAVNIFQTARKYRIPELRNKP